MELGGRLVELVLERGLDAQVDGQRHRALAGGGVADVVVERGFRPGEALAAGVGEAHQMRGGVAQRIDPLLFRLEADARQAQVMHLGADFRRQAADHEGAASGA